MAPTTAQPDVEEQARERLRTLPPYKVAVLK